MQRPLIELRVVNALMDEHADRLTVARLERVDKSAAAQELRQAQKAADLLVEEQWEVPTFWRHAIGSRPAAEQVEAAHQLRQALEDAESMVDQEQWE